MTPKRNMETDSMAKYSPEPFMQPRTIPMGWEVSGFFEPEQRYPYRPDMYGHTSEKSARYPDERTEDAV